MVFNDVLEKEIPEGWRDGVLGDFVRYNYSTYGNKDIFTTIEYLDTSNITNNETIEYFQSKAEMSVSTYPSIKPEDILNTKIVIPNEISILSKVSNDLSVIYKKQWLRKIENNQLIKVKEPVS